MDWNVGDLERSVSGGPIRSEKMDSSNNLTPLIFGPEPVVITIHVKITSRIVSYPVAAGVANNIFEFHKVVQ